MCRKLGRERYLLLLSVFGTNLQEPRATKVILCLKINIYLWSEVSWSLLAICHRKEKGPPLPTETFFLERVGQLLHFTFPTTAWMLSSFKQFVYEHFSSSLIRGD